MRFAVEPQPEPQGKIPTARTEPQRLRLEICGCGSTANRMPIPGLDSRPGLMTKKGRRNSLYPTEIPSH